MKTYENLKNATVNECFSINLLEMLASIDNSVKFDNKCNDVAGFKNYATVFVYPYFASTLESISNIVASVASVLSGFGYTATETEENVLKCTNADGNEITVYLPDLSTFYRRENDVKEYYAKNFKSCWYEYFKYCYLK